MSAANDTSDGRTAAIEAIADMLRAEGSELGEGYGMALLVGARPLATRAVDLLLSSGMVTCPTCSGRSWIATAEDGMSCNASCPNEQCVDGLVSRPHGGQPLVVLAEEASQMRHERDLLAEALGKLLVHLGGVDAVPMTGPELLAFTDDALSMEFVPRPLVVLRDDLEQVGYWFADEYAPERMGPSQWEQERLVSVWTVEDEGGFLPEHEAKAEPVYVIRHQKAT